MMQSHLEKFSLDITRLEGLVQVQEANRLHNWDSAISMNQINNIFENLNKTLDDAEKMLEAGVNEIQPTKLSFKVPTEHLPNKGMWESLSCFCIDKLTKAMIEDHKEDFESAVFDLIDIGRAYDREMDGEADPYELHDDENRSRNLYGNIYDDTEEFNAGLDAKNHGKVIEKN